MNEETTTTTITLEGSAFARVLGRIMEARDIPADQEHVLELAEKSGYDRETFRARLTGEDADSGDLSSLAGELALSQREKRILALAYALEQEPVDLDADPRADWTQWERKHFDAQADHEAWSLAHQILEPWVQSARPIGSDEHTRVMEKALAEVEGEYNRTLEVLERLRGEAR